MTKDDYLAELKRIRGVYLGGAGLVHEEFARYMQEQHDLRVQMDQTYSQAGQDFRSGTTTRDEYLAAMKDIRNQYLGTSGSIHAAFATHMANQKKIYADMDAELAAAGKAFRAP